MAAIIGRAVMHEGAGASSLDIDLDEQLTAAWFVPFDEGSRSIMCRIISGRD